MMMKKQMFIKVTKTAHSPLKDQDASIRIKTKNLQQISSLFAHGKLGHSIQR